MQRGFLVDVGAGNRTLIKWRQTGPPGPAQGASKSLGRPVALSGILGRLRDRSTTFRRIVLCDSRRGCRGCWRPDHWGWRARGCPRVATCNQAQEEHDHGKYESTRANQGHCHGKPHGVQVRAASARTAARAVVLNRSESLPHDNTSSDEPIPPSPQPPTHERNVPAGTSWINLPRGRRYSL